MAIEFIYYLALYNVEGIIAFVLAEKTELSLPSINIVFDIVIECSKSRHH